MRISFIIALLAATAAIPAMASAEDQHRGRGGDASDRGAQHQGGWQGRQGGVPAAQPQRQQQQPRQFQPQVHPTQGPASQGPAPQFQRRDGGGGGNWRGGGNWQGRNDGQNRNDGQGRGNWQGRGNQPQVQQPQQIQNQPRFQPNQNGQARQNRDPRRNDGQGWQGRPQGGDRQAVQQGQRNDGRRDGNWRDNGQRNDGWRNNARGNDGWRNNDRYQGQNRGNWNRNWRQDRRYDWSARRAQNRNEFHLPRYYAPYGWDYGYRRFGIGLTLSSVLFAENYWIDDPDYYGLPPAYGPYRWVRYYNDALLVDIYTGQVVDTVYDIFW